MPFLAPIGSFFGAIGSMGAAGAAGGTAGVLGSAYSGAQVAAGVVTVAGAASTGYSIYSGYQQGAAAEKAAAYNAAVQRNNAALQRKQVERQAIQDRVISENQVAWQNYNAQVQKNNAVALENQARTTDENARENIRRERERKRRVLGNIRASAASQGLNVGEGTVVESLAATSEILELDILDISRKAQEQMNNFYYQAELTRAGVGRAQAEAGIMQMRADDAGYNYSTGRYIEMFGNKQADMTLLAGSNSAFNSRAGGWASAISGLGNTAGTYMSYRDDMPRKSNPALTT